jgi:hypothetical protein
MASSCNTQVKRGMSSGSVTPGLFSCSWFQALKPVAYNTMTAGESYSGQASKSNALSFGLSHCILWWVSLKRKVWSR